MSNSDKQNLAFKILLKNAFAIDEKGVFDTLKKGDKVLNDYQDFPNIPHQNLAEFQHSFGTLNAKNNFQIEFQLNAQVVSFQQLSRPPTIKNVTKFDFKFVRTLDEISRNINPRSPPTFS